MKNKNYFLSSVIRLVATFIGTLGVVACSPNWSQNPLAKKDRALQNAQREPTPREKPTGVSSDYVRLEYPEYFSFQEGTANEFVLRGRILLPGYAARVFVENLAEFSGASFDEASGKFSWKPPIGLVGTNSPVTKETMLLRVAVIGTGGEPEDEVVKKEFTIPLEVGKAIGVPVIFYVSQNRILLREGEVETLKVRIRDPDAIAARMATWPSLQVLPIVGFPNISPFMTITSINFLTGNEYEITLKVNLHNMELTKSKTGFGFGLQAFSRYKEGSEKQNVFVNVLTSFTNLQSTWFDSLEFSLDGKSEHQFLIYDPKEELLVGTPTFTGAPPGAHFTCSGVGVSRQLCKMTWTPQEQSMPGEFVVNAQIIARNQERSDTEVKEQAFNLKMKVLPAATPVPSPTPPEPPLPPEPSPSPSPSASPTPELRVLNGGRA